MESIYRWSLLYWWSVTGLFRLFSSATVVPLFMRKRVVNWLLDNKKPLAYYSVSYGQNGKRTHTHTHNAGPPLSSARPGAMSVDIRTRETDSSLQKRDDLRPRINTTYLFKRSLFNLPYLRRPQLPSPPHLPIPVQCPNWLGCDDALLRCNLSNLKPYQITKPGRNEWYHLCHGIDVVSLSLEHYSPN